MRDAHTREQKEGFNSSLSAHPSHFLSESERYMTGGAGQHDPVIWETNHLPNSLSHTNLSHAVPTKGFWSSSLARVISQWTQVRLQENKRQHPYGERIGRLSFEPHKRKILPSRTLSPTLLYPDRACLSPFFTVYLDLDLYHPPRGTSQIGRMRKEVGLKQGVRQTEHAFLHHPFPTVPNTSSH